MLKSILAYRCKSRAVHEVEEIAIVGAEVQHGRGTGPTVTLLVQDRFSSYMYSQQGYRVTLMF